MYRVSVLQFEPKLGDVTFNLGQIRQLLSTLESDLVVLPELCLSGYVFNHSNEIEAQDPETSEVFSDLKTLSREKDSSIVLGFAERSGDKLFNSSALINPDGSLKVYRKTHLFYREKLFFNPGDTGFFVAEAKGGIKIGMMICFDWQFPESMRTLSLLGAQIVCHPSNLVMPWCQEAMKTRSLENRVFSITANRIGTEANGAQSEYFTGQSQILGHKGEILIRLATDSEELATVLINPNLALDKSVSPFNDVLADRRPEFYKLS
ncbi:MAG TPA: nitrilase-related carbon-nitrogen hydrolase [Candidatus Cloacimonadota bacterium]|nr:nitrilase-related carbon-nitrogen hydrolase [Candidatus Cloacimonadota bacterium]